MTLPHPDLTAEVLNLIEDWMNDYYVSGVSRLVENELVFRVAKLIEQKLQQAKNAPELHLECEATTTKLAAKSNEGWDKLNKVLDYLDKHTLISPGQILVEYNEKGIYDENSGE